MASGDAVPVPRKNTAYRVTFPIYDADGDLVTGATGLDSEISKDGGTFADATSEATEIATSSGMYYLDLTNTEMNADTVAIIVKTSSAGAKTTVLVLYPEEAGDIRVDAVMISGDSAAADNLEAMFDGTGYAGGTIKLGVDATSISGDSTAADKLEALMDGLLNNTAQAGAAGTVTLNSGAVATDDYYNGFIILITGGTGVGQARLITDYVGSTKVATISPNWATNPDATSTFILFPMGALGLATTALSNIKAMFDGTGYAGGTIPLDTNVKQVSGDATAADNLEAEYDGTGFKSYLRRSTAQAGAAGTITLDASASATDDLYNGLTVAIVSGTGAGQARLISDYVGSTKVATVSTSWATNPDATSVFLILPPGRVSVDVPVKKNTALSNFAFLMIDSTDDIAGKTGLTVTATRSIDGGAFASCTNSVTEVSNGVYKINLSAADLNGDVIILKFTATGANTTFERIVTTT